MNDIIMGLAKEIRETPDNMRNGRAIPIERLFARIEREHGAETLIAAMDEACRQGPF
jgi:hypothetical protein